MAQKELQKGSLEASGRPWPTEAGLGVILGSILAPNLDPQIVKNEAEFQAEFWEGCRRLVLAHLEASGVDFGSNLVSFLTLF